jgi:ATP-dependent Clp protease ATP-binding subunit ClpA
MPTALKKLPTGATRTLVSIEGIANAILLVRGQRVMLDTDLAGLYGVSTKVLNQAVKRNLDRFPDDFMFQLGWQEASDLRSQTAASSELSDREPRSQSVTLKRGTNIKYRPRVFTEQGVAMLSSVLRSPRAITVNIEIMRAFVRLREVLTTNKDLARRFAALEARIEKRLAGQDQAIVEILDAIRRLMNPPSSAAKRKIGFV